MQAVLPLLRQAVIENKRAENSITSAAVLNVSSVMGCSSHIGPTPIGLSYRVAKVLLFKYLPFIHIGVRTYGLGMVCWRAVHGLELTFLTDTLNAVRVGDGLGGSGEAERWVSSEAYGLGK